MLSVRVTPFNAQDLQVVGDAITMIDVLRKVEKIGEIKIIRTAGLDVIHLLNEHSFQECVENYYANL